MRSMARVNVPVRAMNFLQHMQCAGQFQRKPRPIVSRCNSQAPQVDPDSSDDRVKCYMTPEGYLVCDLLEPGNYRVESLEVDRDTPKQCSLDNPRDCLTYCYVLDDGTMVCEGLPSGEYAIKQAAENEIDDMLQHLEGLRDRRTTEGSTEPGPIDQVMGQIIGKLRES